MRGKRSRKQRGNVRWTTPKPLPGKNNVDKIRSCEGKLRHNTYAEAKAAAERLPGLRAYKCRHCDYCHVGRSR